MREKVLICVFYTLIRQLAPKKQMIHSLWWHTLILALFLFWCRSGLSRVCVCVCVPLLAFLPFYLKLDFSEPAPPFLVFFSSSLSEHIRTFHLSLSLSHTHTQNPLLRFIFCVKHTHTLTITYTDIRTPRSKKKHWVTETIAPLIEREKKTKGKKLCIRQKVSFDIIHTKFDLGKCDRVAVLFI